MSTLISNPNPVVIPPTEAKTYPNQWIYSFGVISPAINEGSVRLELLPYSSENQEILGGVSAETISFNLWEAMAVIPEAQQIFGLIVQSIPKFRDFANKTGEFAPIEPPIDPPVEG